MTCERRFYASLLFAVAGCLFMACEAACVPLTPVGGPAARLDREAAAIVGDYQLPGMTIAVASPTGVIAAAAGYADREHGAQMTPRTRMLAASIGKTFVSATLLQLADEGQLALDDPIAKWLSDREWFARLPNGSRMTIRHLLQHRSGVPDHVYLEAFAELWPDRIETVTREDLIALIFDVEPLFAPGESWAYSDTGYLLLGIVLESVTGESFEDVIRERFIEPLQLSSTGPSNRKHLPGLARGYVSTASGFDLPPVTTGDDGVMLWNPAIEGAGGGLYATSCDLALWGYSFFAGRILAEPIYREAITGTPASEHDAQSFYGLGIAIRTDSTFGAVYGHRGWIPGYVSSLQYYPVHDIAIAFQINTDIGIADTQRPVMLEIEERLAKRFIRP